MLLWNAKVSHDVQWYAFYEPSVFDFVLTIPSRKEHVDENQFFVDTDF